jgi:hypothetical protein
MAGPPRKSEKDDFDPADLLAYSEQHETKISELTERTLKIETLLSTPQNLATFFEQCSSDSRNFDNVFAKMFCRFMEENTAVREAVQKRVAESDRNFVRKTFKRFGGWVYAGVLIFAGAVGKELVQWVFNFFPHR